ncbi:hypothetical protein BDP55DRAFT_732827 [Colletotrichum godetiae]|uniref:Uncharacterized protein n=1 Tax=Colletotrichum godetiae TaxID=1209918 RepID=A0AAJ0ESX1_9PEZI|nr:uncharacterized protein BDP55DRAFT_732827 [Colletotrichum godetiae]KAK1659959.1 hypothetical protein BDP55DRAFT_732827 [Colletotrichum godetiae]
MYVYLGKLDWKPYGQDETFVITLPNGPARAGDPAYLFSQWTKDARGAQKANWFLNLVVDKVSKTASGDDVFTLKNSHYYSWEITTQKVYGELKVAMSNPNKEKRTMTLKQVWKSETEVPKGALRIWTGKINWPNYATNEMATFIVPEGFGKDKPVLAVWQWTQNGEGKPKNPNLHVAKQNTFSSSGKGVKFEYDSFYHLNCTWQEQTERLSVHMKGRDSEAHVSQELGEYALAVLYDRHSHDFGPPESTPNKVEVDHRLPQTQPSLARITTPMPFPRGLVDTLTHAQAFIDQAGYLAKYAEERFQALDADLHARDHQLQAAQKNLKELAADRDRLIDDLKVEKARAASLQGSVKTAQEKVKKLEAEVKELQERLQKDIDHDDEDHKRIMKLELSLEDARAERDLLLTKLNEVVPDLAATKARLETELDNVKKLVDKLSILQTTLDVQKKRNEKLVEQNGKLTTTNVDLEDLVRKLKGDIEKLEGTASSFGQTQARLNSKIQALETARDGAQDERNISQDLLIKERDKAHALEDKLKIADKKIDKFEDTIDIFKGILNNNGLSKLIPA